MPRKYRIPTIMAPPRFPPVGKYAVVESREDCAGSCRNCVKKNCVYNTFGEDYRHWEMITEPEYLYSCLGCFRCVQECTRGIFSRVVNPDYRTLGDGYWRPEIIHKTWYQAHTGRIPVSGAGYRGPFVGEGFDSMWTDMSEIVRPTRDGIHGREYINTTVELSRRLTRLEFGQDLSLLSDPPPILEVPLPLLLERPSFGVLGENVLLAMAGAARSLGTMMLVQPEDCTGPLARYVDDFIPCLTRDNLHEYTEVVRNTRMVELADQPGVEEGIAGLRTLRHDLCVSVSIPLNKRAASRALELARSDVDTLRFCADSHGNELDTPEPRFLKEMIREVHLGLVRAGLRQKLNLVFSGGIAMAEHMAKAMLCGADAVTIDLPLLVALECRLCDRCIEGLPCPVRLEEIDPEWGCQRILNLVGAWRNQLIEVMGAMGIREARRLRGEVGRSLWFEDLERESFGPLFGERKVKEPASR